MPEVSLWLTEAQDMFTFVLKQSDCGYFVHSFSQSFVILCKKKAIGILSREPA